MNYFNTALTGLALLAGVTVFGQNQTEQYKMKRSDGKENIDAFPKAKEGYKQFYIQIPKDKKGKDLKFDFFVGYDAMVDCNSHSLTGNVKVKNLEGSRYKYYEVESDGSMLATNRGCGGQAATEKFVYFQPEIKTYSSKFPLVLYVPKSMEVRYRISGSDAPMEKADQK